MPEQNLLNTNISSVKHIIHSLLAFRNKREHFTSMLWCHFKQGNQYIQKVKSVAVIQNKKGPLFTI